MPLIEIIWDRGHKAKLMADVPSTPQLRCPVYLPACEVGLYTIYTNMGHQIILAVTESDDLFIEFGHYPYIVAAHAAAAYVAGTGKVWQGEEYEY